MPWFNPSQQLSTTQLLTQFPSPTSPWDEGENRKNKSEKT